MATGKDGLFKRGRIYWAWVRGQRVSCRTSDRAAAKIFKAKLERAAADPAYLAANETTVAESIGTFLRDFATRDRSKHTLIRHKKSGGHIARIVGDLTKLADVNSAAVDDYIATRTTETATRMTIGNELTTLRGVLRLAKRHGKYTYDLDTVMPISFSTEYKPRDRALEWQELAGLLTEVHRFSPLHARMLAFIVATGARKSEAEAAQPCDVDWKRRVVFIRGKKTKSAWADIPILPPFEKLLEYSEPAPFGVWSNMTRDLAAACRRAGIPKATANDFRRTTGTLLRRAGVATNMIARMLRHTDSRMAERVYGRINAEDAGKVIAVQIRHSLGVFSVETSAKSPELLCPGPESNRRHVNFQGDGRPLEITAEAENSTNVSVDASDGSPVSGANPYINDTAAFGALPPVFELRVDGWHLAPWVPTAPRATAHAEARR